MGRIFNMDLFVQAAPALPQLLIAIHVIDGIWLLTLVVHLIARWYKGEVAIFKLRDTDRGRVIIPQSRAILTIAACITAILFQINLVSVQQAIVDRNEGWVVAFNGLLEYSALPLALGAWTMAHAALTFLWSQSQNPRKPPAWIVNFGLFFGAAAFTSIQGSLWGESLRHLQLALDAEDLPTLADQYNQYRYWLKVSVAVFSACEFLFVCLYLPTSLAYIIKMRRLYQKRSRFYLESQHGSGLATARQVQLSKDPWLYDRRFIILIVEMSLVIIGILIEGTDCLWLVVNQDTAFTDPESFSIFLGFLHLGPSVSGSIIATLATIRILSHEPRGIHSGAALTDLPETHESSQKAAQSIQISQHVDFFGVEGGQEKQVAVVRFDEQESLASSRG